MACYCYSNIVRFFKETGLIIDKLDETFTRVLSHLLTGGLYSKHFKELERNTPCLVLVFISLHFSHTFSNWRKAQLSVRRGLLELFKGTTLFVSSFLAANSDTTERYIYVKA